MQTLIIKAVTRKRALGLYEALMAFRSELVEGEDGQYRVEIELGGSEREIVDVLNTLESYVMQRASGPARIELNGRNYTLHAEPEESVMAHEHPSRDL